MLYLDPAHQEHRKKRITLLQKLIILNSLLVIVSILAFAWINMGCIQRLYSETSAANQSQHFLMAYRHQASLALILLCTLLCTASALLACFIYHRPLEQVTQYTHDLAKGESARHACFLSDEFESIYHSCRLMSERLRHAQMQLEAWDTRSEELLEQRYQLIKQECLQEFHAEKLATMDSFIEGVVTMFAVPLESLHSVVNQLSQESRLSPHLQRSIISVSEEMKRCQSMVCSLQNFCSPQLPIKVACDINQLAYEAMKAVEAQLMPGNLTVLRQFDTSVAKVSGVPELLKQAIINIITNACQAMQSLKRGSLHLTTQTAASPESVVKLTVKDTGVGIADEHVGKLFEPFFTTRRTKDAAGLGLTAAYGIIRAHQGTISITGSQYNGTTVVVCLPALKNDTCDLQQHRGGSLAVDYTPASASC